jgi:transposase
MLHYKEAAMKRATSQSSLRAENLALRAENLELKAQLQIALERIAELERRLNLNSSNSSKPPSSDGLKQTRRSSLRVNGKPSGGQPGHKGTTLAQTDKPDNVVKHEPPKCSKCSASLDGAEVVATAKRQVFDIPPVKVTVTEHRCETKKCSHCGTCTTGEFPKDVKAPAQYGERLYAYGIYLMNQQLLPEDRVQQTLEDLLCISPTTYTLKLANSNFAAKVEPIQEAVLGDVKAAAVKHADETGFRVNGKTWWLHVLATQGGTHYRVSQKRKDLEPIQEMSGVLVHDHWKPYFQLTGVSHALCNAHHLRELKALKEIEKESWAIKMDRLLRAVNRLASPAIERISPLYDHIVAEGLAFHQSLSPFSTKTKKRRPGHNLLLRLQDFKDAVLRFVTKPEVPFTNNLAEQDIRMMKVKQKISGGFRTEAGAKDFATIRGFISTARKNGQNILEAIQFQLQAA